MADRDHVSRAATPRWRRIVDFPLIAMVIALALVIGALAVISRLSKLLSHLGEMQRSAIISVVLIAVVVTLYKLVIRHLGEHPRDDLPAVGAVRDLGAGLLLGLLLFSLIVGIAALLDVYNIVGAGGTAELFKLLITVAIVPAVLEELLFRGILFRWIEEFAGSWAALALTSALFGLGHIVNPNATALSSFAIALEAGVLLGGAYMLTRSLWMPIGLHAAWNFTQGFIFDVPVSGVDQQGMVEAKLSGPELLSGGAFGLEASIIAMTVATAAGIAVLMLAVGRGRLVAPMWSRARAPQGSITPPSQSSLID